jgi:nucleotide-binding universal stress UspA family protein
MGTIAVGVDGSEHARRALAWAVEEARLRSCDVLVVHSWDFPPAMKGADGLPHADLLAAAQKVIDEAIAAVDTSGVEIRSEVAPDLPAQALIRASQTADLAVVGSRGLGGFKGLLLGSVAHQVSAHAGCPVVIVPHEERR